VTTQLYILGFAAALNVYNGEELEMQWEIDYTKKKFIEPERCRNDGR